MYFIYDFLYFIIVYKVNNGGFIFCLQFNIGYLNFSKVLIILLEVVNNIYENYDYGFLKELYKF